MLGGSLAVASASPASAEEVTDQATNGSVSAQAACVGPNAISSVVYKVDGVIASSYPAVDAEGKTVEVEFTLAAGCQDVQVGLAAYNSPSATWDPSAADKQVLKSQQSMVVSTGTTNSLMVTAPNCFYQVDFFTGAVLPTLSDTSNYGSGGRLISAGHGGTSQCLEVTEEPTTTTTLPVTTTTLATEVLGETITKDETPEVAGELAETGVPTGSMMSGATLLTLLGAAMCAVGASVRITRRAKHFRKA